MGKYEMGKKITMGKYEKIIVAGKYSCNVNEYSSSKVRRVPSEDTGA